jgi:CobQ-like glutamine amidotransferase family enzyme
MTSVKLVSIFGDRLNINGDQANLTVLQKRLQWAGVTSQVIKVTSREQLLTSNADFILLGHGSRAAWASCENEWPTLASDFAVATQGTSGLAVGSGATKVSEQVEGELDELKEPLSTFAVDVVDGRELLGYKYSEVTPAASRRVGRALLTWLHGPVLAKNPELADQIIVEIIQSKGQEVPASLANENTRKIDEILASVWQLEKPQS